MAPIDPGVAVSLASSAAIGLLGVAVLLSGSRRVSTFSFSAFLLLWSGLLVAGNLSRIPAAAGDLAASRTWLLVLSAFLTVVYLPLVHFAESFPTERGWLIRTTSGVAFLTLPAALGGVAMIVEPGLFHEGFRRIGDSIQSAWGPFYVLFLYLFVGAFYLLVYRLVQQYRGADLEIERLRARDLLLAVSLHLAFASTESTFLFGYSIYRGDYLPQDVAFILIHAAGIAVMAWAGREVLRRDDQGRLLALGAVALPAAFGGVSALTRVSPALPAVLTRGIWRFLAVAVIAYAVLRYEMFDIDARAGRGTALAGAFVLVVGAGFGVSRLVEAFAGSAGVANVAGVAAAGGIVLALAHRRPGFLLALEDRIEAPGRLDRRRLEVYEAAVVRERSRDEPTTGRTLERLRRDLDLTDAEVAVLEKLVAEGGVGGQAPEPEAGTVVGDRYELEAPAGAGRSGRAWRAHDGRTGDTVVVKILDRPLSDREAVYGFLRESRAARRVDHPNIVTVRDLGIHGEQPYLVLDHVAGGGLDDQLGKEDRLDPLRAVGVLDDVLSGLQALHEAGVVHRDVKVENVLLEPDGQAVLADLDLAGPLDPDATVAGLGDVTRAGTPATMSPEVAAGEDATPASDVYAAGAILHHLLAGEPYVDLAGVRPQDLPQRIANADPPELPEDVPDALEAVVRRALQPDPGDRYPSAEAMREALEAAA